MRAAGSTTLRVHSLTRVHVAAKSHCNKTRTQSWINCVCGCVGVGVVGVCVCVCACVCVSHADEAISPFSNWGVGDLFTPDKPRSDYHSVRVCVCVCVCLHIVNELHRLCVCVCVCVCVCCPSLVMWSNKQQNYLRGCFHLTFYSCCLADSSCESCNWHLKH